jgi:hypothetical protein
VAWIPACAGMTTFYEFISFEDLKGIIKKIKEGGKERRKEKKNQSGIEKLNKFQYSSIPKGAY